MIELNVCHILVKMVYFLYYRLSPVRICNICYSRHSKLVQTLDDATSNMALPFINCGLHHTILCTIIFQSCNSMFPILYKENGTVLMISIKICN